MLHHNPYRGISQSWGTVLNQMDKAEIIPNSSQISRPLVGRNWNKLNISVLLQNAPAIGTFYVRLAPGDDALRVDALASTFGRDDLHLLGFTRTLVPYTTALPLVQHLLGEYGGLSVYNAALYVVDKEVRLHVATVDHVYLSVLRRQLGQSVQYDRSTRRFIY